MIATDEKEAGSCDQENQRQTYCEDAPARIGARWRRGIGREEAHGLLSLILQGSAFANPRARGHPRHAQAYSPPTVRPSMRMVGAATDPRNSRSLPISVI